MGLHQAMALSLPKNSKQSHIFCCALLSSSSPAKIQQFDSALLHGGTILEHQLSSKQLRYLFYVCFSKI